MKRFSWAMLLSVAALALLGGCTQQQIEKAFPQLAGIWQASTGNDLFGNSALGRLQFLELKGASGVSGTGEVYGIHSASNILACTSLVFAAISEDVLSISSDRLLFSGGVRLAGTKLFLYDKPNDTTLVITNEAGVSETFTKVSAVPGSAACETRQFQDSFTDIPLDLSSFSNIVSDGVSLQVFGRDGFVYPVNPTTGQLGLGQDLNSSFDEVITKQGTDFWAHCGCGNVKDVQRIQVGGASVDQIDTDTDLGQQIVAFAGVYDGTQLWLAGFSRDLGVTLVLQVNSDVEPDVLVSSFQFDRSIQALTFFSGQYWALVSGLGPTLVQLDMVSGKAVRTISLPDVGGFYQGVTALNGKLYLLVDESGAKFSIYSIVP